MRSWRVAHMEAPASASGVAPCYGRRGSRRSARVPSLRVNLGPSRFHRGRRILTPRWAAGEEDRVTSARFGHKLIETERSGSMYHSGLPISPVNGDFFADMPGI